MKKELCIKLVTYKDC